MMFTFMLNEAWISIRGTKLRTSLAILGIVIGVGSVVLMMTIGAGSRATVEKAIAGLGSNMLLVSPGNPENGTIPPPTTPMLNMEDAQEIAQLPTVMLSASFTLDMDLLALANGRNFPARLKGTTPEYFTITNWQFVQGEPFSANDVKRSNKVAVLAHDAARNLFPEEMENGISIIGNQIKMEGIAFTVVGVLKSKGLDFNGQTLDNLIFVPITTANSRLIKEMFLFVEGMVARGVVGILVQTSTKEEMDYAITEITELLRQRHRIRPNQSDNFVVKKMLSVMQAANATNEAFSLLLGAIASISLIVGAIGIMNIMLVSVVERTREIGIRKAIGATRHHILLQFVCESIIIAVIGSLMGLVIGFGGGIIAENMFGLQVEYTQGPIIMSLSVSVVIGILSGFYPAYKAANLQPIDALRSVGT